MAIIYSRPAAERWRRRWRQGGQQQQRQQS